VNIKDRDIENIRNIESNSSDTNDSNRNDNRNSNKNSNRDRNRSRWFKRLLRNFSVFTAIISGMLIALFVSVGISLPSHLSLIAGEEFHYSIPWRYFSDMTVNRLQSKIGINDKLANLDIKNGINLTASNIGSHKLVLQIFNFIPLKNMIIDVLPYKNIVPCGNSIGVKMNDNWVTIADLEYFIDEHNKKCCPAKGAGLLVGDKILKINDISVNDINKTRDIIQNSNGNGIELLIDRNGQTINSKVVSRRENETKKFKIGIWIRDGMTGIGTLTCYDKETKIFSSLGHPISEEQFDKSAIAENGSIVKSSIFGVKKATAGTPGEIHGEFDIDQPCIGNIICDTKVGIIGKIDPKSDKSLNSRPIKVSSGCHIKEGEACILSSIDGDKVEKFKIVVRKVLNKSNSNNKDIVLEIIDDRLLNKTGGIIQGMSGSPIIQDDALIGAVTHVFVNCPKKGYGIFIEKMIKTMIEAEKFHKGQDNNASTTESTDDRDENSENLRKSV